MRSGYVWFLRAMRVLPVIAGAALIGGIIGGFAMFAIDSAFTWEPVSQRPEARADNQANAAEQRATRPVRVVGGAIPDPSAGMSAPPPQPRRSSAPAQPQISSQLLAPKPLGPASQLQPQNQTANLKARVQTQNAAATPQQPTRWPDALSRAHQNAAMPGNTTNANVTNATNAPQQTTALPASAAVPPGDAPSVPMIRIALTLPATAAIADAMVGATVGATAATMMPRRLQRAGKTRGLTIAFMIPTATAGAGTATCRT